MPEAQFATPVAFIIFNRPDTTARVFAEIARIRPTTFLVVADGPREGRDGETANCMQARAVIDQVDWPCNVMTHFSESNLGCRRRVSSGIDWIFENVSEAIILEDDCLPDATFFPYCAELLARYRTDARVGMICGDNFQFDRKTGESSYYFSRYAHIWGWATWRRAWKHYDVNASLWPMLRDSGSFERITLPCERDTWRNAFEGVFRGRIDTWDYQWTLACWCHSMLAVMPQENLISNIGFGPNATHTSTQSVYANLPTRPLTWPLAEPEMMLPNAGADEFTAQTMFGQSMGRRILNRMRRNGIS